MLPKGTYIILILLLSSLQVNGQNPDSLSRFRPGYVNSVVVNNDTLHQYFLFDVTITASDSVYKAKYTRFLRYVRKTYPYVMLAKQLVAEYEKDIAEKNSKRAEKKYINQEFEELKDRFTDGIAVLSVNEGKVLVKLIHRETGMTAYEIAHKYLGTARALIWQGISRTGGANLKLTFNPDEVDDKILEGILKKVEKGEIWVPKDPFVPANRKQYEKERRQKSREYKQEQKKKSSAASTSSVK